VPKHFEVTVYQVIEGFYENSSAAAEFRINTLSQFHKPITHSPRIVSLSRTCYSIFPPVSSFKQNRYAICRVVKSVRWMRLSGRSISAQKTPFSAIPGNSLTRTCPLANTTPVKWTTGSRNPYSWTTSLCRELHYARWQNKYEIFHSSS